MQAGWIFIDSFVKYNRKELYLEHYYHQISATDMKIFLSALCCLAPLREIASAFRNCFLMMCCFIAASANAQQGNQVTTANGIVEGITLPGTGIRSFRGIPFAQPPVGELRWKEPQPVQSWSGVRKAGKFGPRAMQKPIFSDMVFRSNGVSEDCLYLNVWTPAGRADAHLPVLVYFYGGGLIAGDGSELRYDGESMATKGIVAVTVNYRLGIFGFFAHPELTKESPHHASGDYGYLDQHAALKWVKQNIAAFGGDPDKITIAGESAGSISVSVQMASPLSKALIAGAIGESGAAINPTLAPIPLAEGEKNGVAFAAKVNAASLADLRAIPAEKLLDLSSAPGMPRASATIDGYVLPKSLVDIFNAGEQAQVPLLAGWNSAEVPYTAFTKGQSPTPENYAKIVKETYGDKAAEVLKLYPGATEKEVITSATALASDRFIVFSTWKWADMHARTGRKPVYRYLFSRPRPAMANAGAATPGAPSFKGASHASEIEYALGNLKTNTVYAWTPDDYKVSRIMETYFANFISTGNPNGAGLPEWKPAKAESNAAYMNIDVNTRLEKDKLRNRYLFLDKMYTR